MKYNSIHDIHTAYKQKKLTVRQLVLIYLSRIAETDKCEGGLNSVIEINPDALFIADMLDEKLKNDEEMPPLFGIPVLLKDNISTGDKMHTSAGSVALADNYALFDAHIVKRLREAGALILGKANMIEFANYMADNMPLGYSSRGGQTFNAYDRAATPSGSSTGSAVAVSANLCVVAVGTETCGSIISPSKANGIVGIKPTLGLLSRHGIIPISFTLDTPGPMARTVADAAILLGAMAGKDDNDAATSSSQQMDYMKYLDKNGLKKARIGISRMFLENANEEQLAIMENAISVMRENGAKCIELPEHDLSSGSKFAPIMKYEFKCGINNYLASLANKGNVPKTLQEIILYNQNNAKEALKYGQNTLINAQIHASGALTEPEYINVMLEREEIIHGFDSIFLENKVDVIFSLAGTGLPALTGFPSMTIPIGMTKDNLPFGSFWIARRHDETALLKVAYAVEQILGLDLKPCS